MTESGKSIFKRIGEIDRRVIFILILLLTIYPLLYPIGLPVQVTSQTLQAYEAINEIPDGSVVLVATGVYVMSLPDMGPGCQLMVQHLFDKQVKIIFASFYVEGPIVEDIMLKACDTRGKEYGVDYVRLGYLPGGETAKTALATDLHGAVSVDYYGTPLEEISILENINDGSDVDMVLAFDDGGLGYGGIVRQYHTVFGIPIVVNVLAVMGPGVEPYIDSGQVKGLVSGMRGGAEYELIYGKPGAAVAGLDAQSLIHLMVLGFIILGNIDYFYGRFKGGIE